MVDTQGQGGDEGGGDDEQQREEERREEIKAEAPGGEEIAQDRAGEQEIGQESQRQRDPLPDRAGEVALDQIVPGEQPEIGLGGPAVAFSLDLALPDVPVLGGAGRCRHRLDFPSLAEAAEFTCLTREELFRRDRVIAAEIEHAAADRASGLRFGPHHGSVARRV